MLRFSPAHPGSGGNNHAVEHWEAKHYPLAVKLGTITPDGADVYSYEEDEMVEDPGLPKHLAHFGINITFMTKVRACSIVLASLASFPDSIPSLHSSQGFNPELFKYYALSYCP